MIEGIPSIPYAYNNHPLVDHLLKTSEIVEWIVKSYNLDAIVTHRLRICLRMSGVSGDWLNRNIVRDLFYYTSLIHDVGKAAIEYQRIFDDNGVPKGRVSFYLHEIPSAIICYKVLMEKGFRDEIIKLGALTVLMHMSAARNPLLLGITEIRKNFPKGWNFSVYSEFLSQELKIPMVDSIRLSDTINFIELMKNFIVDVNNKYAKIYTIILAPLIAGDNIDASRARSGDKSISQSRRKLMEEFLRIFKVSKGENNNDKV